MSYIADRKECGIVFVDAVTNPGKNDPWEDVAALLLNPCDGYHHAFARFDGDGEFKGFFNFLGTDEFTRDFYVAWALLPDELPLIRHFDPRRRGQP